MHFGEYELSPSLIGLSLLPSGHPKAFQRLPVRSSSGCYPAFNLPKGRSLGFASTYADSHRPVRTRFRFGSGLPQALASPASVTRRVIMQKARRHHTKWLRPLVGT